MSAGEDQLIATVEKAEDELNGLAVRLRDVADRMAATAGTLLGDAISMTPWKLRRTALQLEELAANIQKRYEKIIEKSEEG